MGDLTLNNRVVMAALTRERCDPELGIPTPLMV
jgi:2,4-dienoyl-CoA reductase-like NADH-dependent reductase (Old Yellow Enzyme family)